MLSCLDTLPLPMSRRTASRVLLAIVLLSLSSFAASLPRVVVLPVAGASGTLKEMGQSIGEQLLTELDRSGQVRAIGTSDLATLIGLERQRVLLGCSEQSNSCAAELSAALGADWLVAGTLGRVGKTLRFDLKVLHASDARVAFRGGRSLRDAGEIFNVVSELTRELVAQKVFDAPRTETPPVASQPSPSATEPPGSSSAATAPPELRPAAGLQAVPPATAEPSRVWPWVTFGAGVAATGVGAFFTLQGVSSWNQLNEPSFLASHTFAEQAALGASHNRDAILGPVLGGVGLAALIGGLAWALVSPRQPALTLGFLPGTNLLVVGGTL
jgi:TolB-like protein